MPTSAFAAFLPLAARAMGQGASRDGSGSSATASAKRPSSAATPLRASAAPSARVLTSVDLARWIDDRGADVELVRCEGDDTPDVASSAAALGVDVSQIVKSLVFAADGAFVVVVSNGETRVDAKKLARALGVANRRVRLATPDETVAASGFAPGTVPPFGHRTPLRTFVDADVPLVPGGVVFGGGGDRDMEVRADVRELLRLTDAELVDLKVSPKVSPNQAPEIAKTAKTTAKPAKPAPATAPAPAPASASASAYDERVGPERRPLSRDVAAVLGVTPAVAVSDVDAAPWRAAANAAAADPVVVRVVAEVLRVRRVARLLAFATLRPLDAPVTVEMDAHDRAARRAGRSALGAKEDDADEEEVDEEEDRPGSSSDRPGPSSSTRRGEALPLAAGTELQLIAGRSLMARLGGASAMETALRALRQGDVVEAEGRLQANPRPMTVDLVARSLTRVEGAAAVRHLARADAEEDAARNARDDRIAALQLPVQPLDATDANEANDANESKVSSESLSRAPRSPWRTREAKEEEWGVGPSAATAAMAAATSATGAPASSSASPSLIFARLRAGDREGKTIRFPSLPPASVSWVADAAGVRAARAAIFGDGPHSSASTEHEPARRVGPARVVGVDAEWRPQTGSRVALLQLATRDRAFLVDALAMASEDASDEDATALDEFLSDILSDATILKIGFGFAHDLARLRRSYPRLAATRDATPTRVVDARAVAVVAFPEKRKLAKSGLAVVVASVLGAYVDKTEQCSDWQRRPLTHAQIAYAAADAHCLTVLFDRCANVAPEALTAALADPDPNLLAEPPRVARSDDDRSDVDGRYRRGSAAETKTKTKRAARPSAPIGPPMTPADVVASVGRSYDGRKAVVAALSGGAEDPGGGGQARGGAETCGEFVALYVNVGSGKNRRYANEFWVERGERGRGGAPSVLMSWFAGSGAGGGARSVATILAAAAPFDAEGSGEGDGDDGDGGNVDAGVRTDAGRRATAVLYLRADRGPYVCCGRLVAAATDLERDGGARVDFRLEDAEALARSGRFDALVGKHMRDPEDRWVFGREGEEGAKGAGG